MIATVLGKLFLLALLFRSEDLAPEPAPSMPVPTGAPPPEPWPAAVPTDLPPFPAGWEYDTPTPPEVVARAWQLLDQLWARGEGAIQQEQTGGRWITYRAELVGSNVKGVTAWRQRAGARATVQPVSVAPRVPAGPAPRVPAAPGPSMPPQIAPANAPARPPAAVPVSYVPKPSTPSTSATAVPFYAPPAGGMTTAQIQTALNAWGASPPLTPDGSYGPLTRAATIAFQHAKGLTEDGKAGALTQTQLQPYLNRAVSVSASPAPRQTPAAAAAPAQTRSVTLSNTQVQTALNAAGAMPPLVVDGSLGPKSKAAVKAFQATHGLAADGVPGPLTQAALMPYLTALT